MAPAKCSAGGIEPRQAWPLGFSLAERRSGLDKVLLRLTEAEASASVNHTARLFKVAQPWQAAIYEKASLLQHDLQVPPRRHSMPSAISFPHPSATPIMGCSAPRHQHGRHLAFQRQLSSQLSFNRRLSRFGKSTNFAVTRSREIVLRQHIYKTILIFVLLS